MDEALSARVHLGVPQPRRRELLLQIGIGAMQRPIVRVPDLELLAERFGQAVLALLAEKGAISESLRSRLLGWARFHDDAVPYPEANRLFA